MTGQHPLASATPALRSVLLCAKGYPPDIGGVQAYSEHVARAYLAQGIVPMILTSRPGPRGWLDMDYPEGRARLFNVGEGSQVRIFLRLLRAGWRIARSTPFDFFHATTWRAAAAIAPWRAGRPLAITVHGREVLDVPHLLVGVMRGLLRRADAVIAVSRITLSGVRQAMAGQTGGGRWIASFNGLSYPEESAGFRRSPPGPILHLYTFCRLIERKNIAGALHALHRLRQRGIDNFDYVISGDGPARPGIERLIAELDLSDRVSLTGYIPAGEIPEAYRRADIFLHPQTAPDGGRDVEGFGLVIADAMSFGALAIAGTAGGPADFIADGRTGILVDGEDVAAIAAAIARAFTDAAACAAIAEQGRIWCGANLSWNRHVADVLAAVSPPA